MLVSFFPGCKESLIRCRDNSVDYSVKMSLHRGKSLGGNTNNKSFSMGSKTMLRGEDGESL